MKLSYCEAFCAVFPDNKACHQYLYQLKNEQPFSCLQCGHHQFSKGRTRYHRRCKSCGYDESPLTGTLFSGIRLPIHKAFYLLYKIRTQRRETSALHLARLFDLHPRTVLRFKKRFAGCMGKTYAAPVSPHEVLQVLEGIICPKAGAECGKEE